MIKSIICSFVDYDVVIPPYFCDRCCLVFLNAGTDASVGGDAHT